MVNNVVLMGRLTKAPELRTTTNGVNVTAFTLAVNRQIKNQDGTYTADFINVVAWRSTADFITKYFTKGSVIAVEGSIQTRKYEDKQGNKRTAFEVIAKSVSFCGSKKESGQASAQPQPLMSESSTDEFAMIDDDGELPF